MRQLVASVLLNCGFRRASHLWFLIAVCQCHCVESWSSLQLSLQRQYSAFKTIIICCCWKPKSFCFLTFLSILCNVAAHFYECGYIRSNDEQWMHMYIDLHFIPVCALLHNSFRCILHATNARWLVVSEHMNRVIRLAVVLYFPAVSSIRRTPCNYCFLFFCFLSFHRNESTWP